MRHATTTISCFTTESESCRGCGCYDKPGKERKRRDMPKIQIADGEIYYEENGQGEPLVFVSGLNGVGAYWSPQVPVFSPRFRVITYDQRGTGQSDRLQREFSVDRMAAELSAL